MMNDKQAVFHSAFRIPHSAFIIAFSPSLTRTPTAGYYPREMR
jgi:hypothetical protein